MELSIWTNEMDIHNQLHLENWSVQGWQFSRYEVGHLRSTGLRIPMKLSKDIRDEGLYKSKSMRISKLDLVTI